MSTKIHTHVQWRKGGRKERKEGKRRERRGKERRKEEREAGCHEGLKSGGATTPGFGGKATYKVLCEISQL